MTHDQRTTLGAMLVGLAVIGAFLYAKSKDSIPSAESTDDGHNPTTNLLGAAGTGAQGALADVRNALLPADTPSLMGGADPVTINNYIGMARAQLHQLLLTGKGNANIDQAEFAGVSLADAAAPLYFYHGDS